MASRPEPDESRVAPSPRRSTAAWAALAGLVALSAALSLFHLDWDAGRAFHPDERALAFAVERVSILDGRFDPDFFAYGSLPIYLVSIARDLHVGVLGSAPDFPTLIRIGRLLSALAGAATVALLFLFARRKAGLAVATLTGALLSLAPIHLQNSRFFTVDALLTLLTLAALVGCDRLAAEGRLRTAVFTGLLVGLACGTKVTGVALALPLALAIWLGVRPIAGARGAFRAGVLSAVSAAASFVLVEPMIVVRFGSVLASLTEQAAIARHAGLVPYTHQFVGVSPVFYPLEQLLVWGLGPALGGAVLWSLFWRLGRGAALGSTSRVLLVWLLPYLLFLALVEAKYPRYLLPAVPLLVLGAARALAEVARRHTLGRIAAALVLGATALQGVAFARLFADEHSAIRAARWVQENAPARSTLLLPDWDEGLPLDLGPDAPTKALTLLSAPYYDRPDDGVKLARLAALLERADFVVFPTRRIYGSIARARDRFPATAGLIENLFAGNLGFDLVAAFESRPRLFGFELPDELADESVTVYDHPRVLIFRRTEPIGAREIVERAHDYPLPPWSLEDFLTAEPGERAEPAAAPVPRSRGGGAVSRTLLLFAAVEALGLAAYALLGARFRRPGAFAASRVIGIFAFAHLTWLATMSRLVAFDASTTRLLGLGSIAVALCFWWRSGRPLPGRREAVWSWLVFYGFVALLLAVRARHPAIFWGEKPMDFGILLQLLRSDSLPPSDPWFAGSPLNYGYFGHFVFAALGKLSGLDGRYLYNVAIALVAGLAASAAFAGGLLLSRRIRTGLWSVTLLLLLGNLSGLFLWQRLGRLDFDFFWATSRIIPDTIDEYPLWSLLFADLHAHLLALPLVILCGAVLVRRLRVGGRRAGSASLGDSLLGGWLAGLVALTSGWSILSLLLLAMLVASVAAFRRSANGGGRLRESLTSFGLPAAVATLASAPHWIAFHAPEGRAGLHLGPVATGLQIATVFALAIVVVAPVVLSALGRLRGGRPGAAMTAAPAPWLLGALVVALAASFLHGPARWPLLAATGATIAACFSNRARGWATALVPFAAGLALLTLAEFFFVWDRLNTVFKYHFDAWVFTGLAAAVVLGRLGRRRRVSVVVGGDLPRRLWRAALAVAMALGVTTSILAALGALAAPRIAGPSGTLDGTAYLETTDPDEAAALRWLNESVPGSPTVLEAHGPSYGAHGRVSMNTGLPTPVGWGYHLFQRAHPWREIAERAGRVAAIYHAESRDEVCAALDALAVDLVYLGALERTTYGAAGGLRLDAWPELLRPVFRNGTVVIYRVLAREARCPSADSGVGGGRAASVSSPIESAEPSAGNLAEPRGVAGAADGFWVSDTGNHRVVKFDLDRRPRLVLGRRGVRAGELEQPCAVATTPSGELLVADTWNHRIVHFDNQGAVVGSFEAGFFGPRGLAVDPRSGDVLVADTGNHRLVRLNAAGAILQSIGDEGSGPGEFREPTGVAVSDDGRIAVSDASNGRVQILDPTGRWLATWRVPEWRRDPSSEPDLVFSSAGDLWLTVPLAGEIRALDRTGALLVRRSVAAGVSGEPAIPLGIAWAPGAASLIVTTLDGRLVEVSASMISADGTRPEQP